MEDLLTAVLWVYFAVSMLLLMIAFVETLEGELHHQ